MKKFTPTRICTTSIFLLCVAFLISTSCQDPDLINDSNTSENTKEVRLAQEALRDYASAISPLISELEFRTNIYTTIEEKFDGESNVLFKTLLDESKNPNYAKKLNSKSGRAGSNLLSPFINIDGNNYFPQIYIPFYDELKADGKIGKEAPRIVIYTNDSPNSSYQSYRIDKQGNLIDDMLVTEEFAKENELWIISINERVNNLGEPLNIYKKSESSNTSKTLASPSAIVDQIKCKCHKESWAAGASEVNIIIIASDFGFFEYDVNLYGKGQNEGGEIYKFSRSDVSNQRNVDVNFFILNNWDERAPNKPYGNYVIFEYDTWPTGTRTATWDLGGTTLNWEYRSADGFYDKQTVYKTNFSFHTVNNDCIEWRSEYR